MDLTSLNPDLQKALVKYINKTSPIFRLEEDSYGGQYFIIIHNNKIRLRYANNMQHSRIDKKVLQEIKDFKHICTEDEGCIVVFQTVSGGTGAITRNTEWWDVLHIEMTAQYIIWQKEYYFDTQTYHAVFCRLLDALVASLLRLV